MNDDQLFAETLARHFEGAKLVGSEIELPWKGVRIQTQLNGVRESGSAFSASLFMHLVGGPFERAVFMSASGYGATHEEAIITGTCNWATSFGPVLRAGLTGETVADVPELEVVHQGQRLRVVLDGLDRGLSLDGVMPELGWVEARRKQLAPSGWMLQRVFDSGVLPVLRGDRPTVLSAFIGDGNCQRRVEIKVDGMDWPSDEAFAQTPVGQEPRMAFLRELALVVPMEPTARLARPALEATLRGLTVPLQEGQRRVVRWPGWTLHEGRLGAPLEPAEAQKLESEIGPLPAGYRDFVTQVAATGAGPGYGLLPPNSEEQRALTAGDFTWMNGTEPKEPPRGVLALAHAGCGVMWLLVLRGEHAGEVWVDAAGSDHIARRVAPDFQDFYRAWLHSCVRDDLSFVQWDPRCCATANVLSQVFESFEKERGLEGEALCNEVAGALDEGAISIASSGGPFFNKGDAVSPCAGCVDLVQGMGISAKVLGLGLAPRQGRNDPGEMSTGVQPQEKKGFWSKLFG